MGLRAVCCIQRPSGSGAMPAIITRRLCRLMTKKTRYLTRPRQLRVSTVKKSAAVMEPRWVLRNVSHDLPFRRVVAGSTPFPCQDPFDRVPADFVAEVAQGSPDPGAGAERR